MTKKSKKKKNPFPNGFTIDGEDSEAVYYTPEMERKIKEEREEERKEEREEEERSSRS